MRRTCRGCGSLDRSFDRDIEAITARATERRASDRIPTAGRLADYLDLYLQGKSLPIRPPGARELAWRWLMRRKAAVAAAAAVLAALALGSVLLFTFLSQRWAVEQGVKADLAEVAQLRDQSRYAEAQAVLKRAEDRLSGGGPAELAGRVAQARKETEMAAELEEIPLLKVRPHEGSEGWDTQATLEGFERAFRDYGIDMSALDPAEATARIRASDIHEQLIVALGNWAGDVPDGDREKFTRLLDTAARADDDAGRKALWQAWAKDDPQVFEKRSDQWDVNSLPSTAIPGFCFWLWHAGSHSRSEQILRAAQAGRPSSFWVNHTLAMILDDTPGGTEEAIGFMRAALAVKPESPMGHYNLANMLDRRGRSAEAEREYREALRLKPDFPPTHYNLGHVLDNRGEFPAAEREYREAIRLKPDYTDAHCNLGILLDRQGQFQEAEREYREAIRLDPDHPQAHCNLGSLLKDRGKFQEAEREYGEAIRLKPKYPEAHYNLGILLANQGKLEAAEGEYREAIRLKPEYPEAHYNLGVLLDKQGKLEAAEGEYREAIRLKSDHPEAHNNLGILLKRQGKRGEAETEYRRALQIKDDFPEAHYNLGVLLAEEGKREEAEREYRRALQLKEDYPAAHNNLGVLLTGQGKSEAAEKEFRRAIQLQEDDSEAHDSLGVLLYDEGRQEEAEKEYRRALQIKEDDPLTHNNLGVLLTGQGKPEAAEKEFRRAIQLKDDYPEAHATLGILLREQGRFGEAIASFQRVLELLPPDDPRRNQVRTDLSQCQHLQELDEKLPAVLNGEVPLKATEQVEYADLCRRYKRRYAAAARLYAAGFTQQPALADDLAAANRYNAACCAALAASGKGEDASDLDDKERVRLRRQALDWLRADLTARVKQRQDDPKARPKIQQKLHYWQSDADLSSVRDKDALAKLPEDERQAWQKLWADVDALLKRTQTDAPKP